MLEGCNIATTTRIVMATMLTRNKAKMGRGLHSRPAASANNYHIDSITTAKIRAHRRQVVGPAMNA